MERRTKKIIFFLLAFFIATGLYAQISFEDAKGVWNNILSLDYVINEDSQPQRLIADDKTYLGWGSSVIVEKGNLLSYRIVMNGGYDDIIESYWSDNMPVLTVENSYGKTSGEVGITFIDRDTIFFTLVSDSVFTPFYFGKEHIYIRASIIIDEAPGTIEDAPKGDGGKASVDAGITTGEERVGKKFVFDLVATIVFIVGGSLIFVSIIKSYAIYNKFKNYLLSIDDKDTFQKIKKLNPFGIRGVVHPFLHIKIREILSKKYEQTKDYEYLTFYRKYMRCMIQSMVAAIFLFILYAIKQIIEDT